MTQTWQVHCGDALSVLKTLPDQSVNCVVTSPPYFNLRDYGHEGQIGAESSPIEYVEALVSVFAECRRVLDDDGTLWVNVGDSYVSNGRYESDRSTFVGDLSKYAHVDPRIGARAIGMKPKDLIGIPWSVAFALRADGWYLRSEIIWHKKSCMPESVKDRPTKAHEQVFLLTKQPRYFYDADAIREKYAESTLEQIEAGYDGEGQKDYALAGVQNPSAVKRRILSRSGSGKWSDPGLLGQQYGLKKVTGNQNASSFGDNVLGANARSVWSLGPEPATDIDHFAVMPKTLARRCILAGCPFGGTVLDPFAGSGTTGVVALEEGRNFVGIELNSKYHAMGRERLANVAPLLAREIAS